MHFKLEEPCYPTNKILYWKGIIDPQGLSSEYEAVIKKIIEGNYAGLDLEKLSGHDVYSVRINQSDRLLFTTIMVKGKPYLMLLDEVLNHDYAKSRFLKPSVLKHYLELHGKAISEELLDAHFEACQLPSAKSASGETIEYSRVDFYNQKFIELDEMQLGAVTKATLPLIISGAPGSGKSCIALLLMGEYLISNPDKEDYPILYVSESENLVAGMKRSFEALPIAQGIDSKKVQFKSYQQLIKELTPEASQMSFVGKEHCITWLGAYIKQYKQPRKGNTLTKVFFADMESMYQEFRIISGCKGLGAYESLGQRQSLHHTQGERQWLFTAYTSYKKALEAQKSIHAPFYPLALQNIFKRIVVDEAQDFSHLQLEILSNLASKRQICFCEDNRQSLADNKSKIPFIKGLMHSWGAPENQLSLNTSYRCPSSVIDMANTVSGLKSIVTGDGQPLIIVPHEETREGMVTWFDKLTDETVSALKQEAQSPHFAIVTTREYKENAKKLFQTPLVFTTDEIKGLEYKKVMAYCLLDEPLFKEADKLIAERSSDFKTTTNRAKKDQGNEQFGPCFNGIYTAFTRATDTLYICQKKHHYLKNICNLLSGALPKDPAELLVKAPLAIPEENLADWFREVKTQLNLGNESIAKNIYLEKLNKTAVEFETFKTMFFEPVQTTGKPVELIPQKSCIQPQVTSPASASATVTSNVSQDKAKDGGIPSAITKLLKNLNAITLEKFFKQEKAKELLFDYPLKDGACLFTRLFYTDHGRDAFFSCILKFPNLLLGGLTEESMCRPRTSAGILTGTSPLFWFASNVEGWEILKKHPELVKTINAQALCLPRPLIAGPCANITPLFMFLALSKGREAFKALLVANPELVNCVSGDALVLKLTAKSGLMTNMSPFYYLSVDDDGLDILKMLLAKNPALAKSVSGSALCSPSLESGENRNTSPLYWLSLSFEGIGILKTLLVRNPELAKSVSVKALCLQRTSAAGMYANMSPLSELSKSSEGQELLTILRSGNPEIDEFLKKNNFYRSLPSTAGMFAQRGDRPVMSESSDLKFN